MPHEPLSLALLVALVLAAAVLYSSVGHAGASGYLAAMALMGVAAPVTRPAALIMNILVATVGTWRFASKGLVPWRLLTPLVLASIPAAYVGGFLSLPTNVHRIALGGVLLFAAARLFWPASVPAESTSHPPAPLVLIGVGAVIGILAGLTGVGGGIFLSPLLILAGWEGIRHTAGASVAFILANSIAGLLGYVHAGRVIPVEAFALAPVALAGGVYGSWLGATRLGTSAMRRLLATVLLVGGLKLVLGR